MRMMNGLIDMTAYDSYFAGDLANFSLSQEEIDRNTAELPGK